MEDKQSFRRGFFPRFIDRPRLLGMFEIDEAGLAFGIMVLLIFGSLAFPLIGSLEIILAGLFLGGFSGYFYRKFKKNRANGYTWHKMYKMGMYHPTDNKIAIKEYDYLKENKSVPYGFTTELYN